jgi:2-amino-4-hydroxy-6-hydroxymethyldihydropteridine diphosphokinase
VSVVAYIGIGSNLGDRAGNVRRAVRALGAAGCVRGVSSLRWTPAWGNTAQPAFVNAAVRLETLLRPRALLRRLQEIERRLGRRTTYRWGPRVIDIDLLLYGRERVAEGGFVVPHPRLFEREFVLVPLAEVGAFERGSERLPR